MAENSKIEWTDHTFNPWIGCTKVSDGCKNCYAEELMDHRYGKAQWGPNGTRNRTKTWGDPIKWNKQAKADGIRRRVFCASLADVFEVREYLDTMRAELFELIYQCRELDWLILTKRPEVAERWMCGASGTGLDAWQYNFPHVWLGTSVENQTTANERIPHLLRCPAAVRFLSCEPLLGSVDLQAACTLACPNGDCVSDGGLRLVQDSTEGGVWIECACSRLSTIDWVIVGGESGNNARPMHPDWARMLRSQCNNSGTPFFFKQWGEWRPATPDECGPSGPRVEFVDARHGDLDEAVAMARVGKAAAGRVLDAYTWDEIPGGGA